MKEKALAKGEQFLNRTTEYLDYALELKPYEITLRNELMQWLPAEIIDVHTHSNLEEHVMLLDSDIINHMMSTFPYFSLEDSHMVGKIFFSGKNVKRLRFPNPYRGINHREANSYLLDNIGQEDRVGLYGIPSDLEYTIQTLSDQRVAALKMYPAYFNPPAQQIYEYFKPEILEEAQSRDIPIILHLPGMLPNCLEDLERIVTDFPRLRIILAHLGLPHLMVPGLEEAYERFSKKENLFMDTAMIPSSEVVATAIKVFGAEKIMFGSDEPLNLIRASVYNNPILGQRLITEKDYHWVDQREQEEFQHLADRVIHMHWLSLIAIKTAIEEQSLKEQEVYKTNIFRANAQRFFNF